MTYRDDGGPAFSRPDVVTGNSLWEGGSPGMSLRDYFAAHALSGILAGGFADTVPHDDIGGGRDAVFFAYQYADAMLRHRDK